jgi:hypothetical protein
MAAPRQSTVARSRRFNAGDRPILLKNSLESSRLVAMLKATRSRGRDGDDGATNGRAEAVVLLIQARRSRCGGSPAAKQRRTFKNLRTHITKAGTIIYRASQSDCANCPMKAHCCPNTPMRKIARSVHE